MMKAECEHGLDRRLPCGDCQKDYEDENAQSSVQHTSLFGIDRLRRGMIAAGVPSEHAAVAAGMAAEYASKAYTHGYDRGFLGGIDWQKARMPNT